jgi:hypothetical protein
MDGGAKIMRVKLEKWYVDFTSEKEVGFYYIMRITIGPLSFGFSGINHFDSSRSLQSFKFSRINRASFHVLHLSKAKFSSNIHTANLQIDHGRTAIEGTWTFLSPPVRRWRKPLYKDSTGWCDWKVWTPRAEVDLVFYQGKKRFHLKGTGYIDFVRLSLPFWKMPFQTLYWGRMHSPRSWSVFLSLQTKREDISLYLDPQTSARDVSVLLKRNNLGKAQSMRWIIGHPSNQLVFEGDITRILESQDVLGKGRSLRILPKGIRRKLSSSCRDEKYEIVSHFRGQSYHGIMEEVACHE